MKGNKLYVGNLNYATTNEKLQVLFAAHGTVASVKIIEGKGFGFVEMSSEAEAEAAKNALNGTEYDGRNIKVDEARPPEERPRRNYNDRRY
jgi:RNA recognition motif-containing protein